MKLQHTYLTDFVALFFPQLCQACKVSLLGQEDLLCTQCLYNLPYTDYHLQPDNLVARQFWGKVQLQAAYAMLHFSKGGQVQHLMHRFKYQNTPRIGNRLGALAAAQLLENNVLRTADVIIPVPLYKSRFKQRGYNQSACFAEGLAAVLTIPVEEHNLIRTRATETQTHKSRFSRFENMQEVFSIRRPDKLTGKHILLVDDIVTTGSTLEACALTLLKVPGVRVSIAAIAYAE